MYSKRYAATALRPYFAARDCSAQRALSPDDDFVTSSAVEVLASNNSMVKTRPLHEATHESRQKAKKCAEFLQPYRQRPETCTALARRLVSGALGVKLSTASQERAEERRLIHNAREKKRQAALHKEAAWDGSLTSQNGEGS